MRSILQPSRSGCSADKAHRIKAILVVQIDTASGVVNDIPAMRKAMDAAKHPALAHGRLPSLRSAACPSTWTAGASDVTMAGLAEGLMTPPGLAFVAANDRARAAHQTAGLRTLYWDWTFREGRIHYQKYCGTPPEHLLFALRKALDMLLAEGLEAAFRRHALLARGDARGGRALGRGPGAGLQHHQSGRALEFDHQRPDAGP